MKKSLLSILAVLIFVSSGVAQYVFSSMVAGIIRGTVTNYNGLPVWASTNALYNQDMYWCKYGTNVYPAGLYRYTRTTKATNWAIFGQGNPIKDKNWITNSFLDRVRWTVNSNVMTTAYLLADTTQSNIVYLRYADYASTNFVNNKTNFGKKTLIASNAHFTGKLTVDGDIDPTSISLPDNAPIYFDTAKNSYIKYSADNEHIVIDTTFSLLLSSAANLTFEAPYIGVRSNYPFYFNMFSEADLKYIKWRNNQFEFNGNINVTNNSILKVNGIGVATTNYVKSNDTSQSNIGRTFTLSRDTAQSNISIVNAKSYDTAQSNIARLYTDNKASTNAIIGLAQFVTNHSSDETNKVYDIPAIAWDFPRGNFPAYFIATNTGNSPSEQISTIRFDDTSEEFILATLKLPSNIKTNANVDFEIQGYSVKVPLAVSTNIRIKFSSSAAGKGNVWDASYITNSSGNYEVDIIQGNIDEIKWSKRISYFGWTANQYLRIKLSRVLPAENKLVGDWALLHFRMKVRIE